MRGGGENVAHTVAALCVWEVVVALAELMEMIISELSDCFH